MTNRFWDLSRLGCDFKKWLYRFNGMPFFKHKGHDGHKGKTHEIKTLFPLCVLCVLCGKALSR
jgi:hypothetical protein